MEVTCLSLKVCLIDIHIYIYIVYIVYIQYIYCIYIYSKSCLTDVFIFIVLFFSYIAFNGISLLNKKNKNINSKLCGRMMMQFIFFTFRMFTYTHSLVNFQLETLGCSTWLFHQLLNVSILLGLPLCGYWMFSSVKIHGVSPFVMKSREKKCTKLQQC